MPRGLRLANLFLMRPLFHKVFWESWSVAEGRLIVGVEAWAAEAPDV